MLLTVNRVRRRRWPMARRILSKTANAVGKLTLACPPDHAIAHSSIQRRFFWFGCMVCRRVSVRIIVEERGASTDANRPVKKNLPNNSSGASAAP